MLNRLPPFVRTALIFLASVIVLYLVAGAVASACYGGSGTVIGDAVQEAESACPDTHSITLDVSDGADAQDVTLYDADCNPIEMSLSASSSVTTPDGGLPSPSGAVTNSVGFWSCNWSWLGEIGGVNVFTFDVSERFFLQPYSNITDWQNPPEMDADLTSAGSLLYDTTGTSGYAIPATQFSPGIYSSLFVQATSGFKYPKAGFTLWKAKHRLDAWVNSPGYRTPTCPGTWTLDIESITDPLPSPSGSWLNWTPWELGCRWMGLSC